MSHCALWEQKTFFYPIGNTAPISLVQDLAPDEDAQILILGCGDPRSILFTICTTGFYRADALPRILDITCCDREAAVLARNIILLSLLMDDDGSLCRLSQLWNIFYNMYLDEDSLSTLISQSRRLLECSATLESWHDSKYGHLLRICATHTLVNIRRIWDHYIKTASMSTRDQKRFGKNFAAAMKDTRVNIESTFAIRSLGPLVISKPEHIELVNEGFRRYWRTGIITSDPTYLLRANFPNPSFAFTSISGDRHMVHYGTDPLSVFHLVETRPSMGLTGERSKQMAIDDLVFTAVSQFRRMCAAFVDVVRSAQVQRLVIRFFAGDALAFCEALSFCGSTQDTNTPFYTDQWQAAPIQLSDDYTDHGATFRAPTKFNVIETSNLTNHVGLLHLLVHCRPLMQTTLSTTLYTESLYSYSNEIVSQLTEQACTDLSSLSLLLGVMPAACASKFSTTSHAHEVLLNAFNSPSDKMGKEFHERIAWKLTARDGCDHIDRGLDCVIEFSDVPKLVGVLFDLYAKMFQHESPKTVGSMADFKMLSVLHYTRRSFAHLVSAAKRRLRVDWRAIFQSFEERATRDPALLLGRNFIQDTWCQFYLLGVDTKDTLTPGFVQVQHRDADLPIFRSWKSIPPVVCIVLTIPRSTVNTKKAFLDGTGTLALQGEVRNAQHGFQNTFGSVHLVFGTLSAVGVGEYREGTLDEDPRGFAGDSPLVAIFQVPTWILSYQDTEVALSIQPTPAVVHAMVQKIGPQFDPEAYAILCSKLLDERHVTVLAGRPNIQDDVGKMAKFLKLNTNYDQPCAVGHVQGVTPMFIVRAEGFGVLAKAALADGASVTVAQHTSCTGELTIDNKFKHIVRYLMPVDISKARLRIARKSAYIEIIAPAALLIVGSESSVGMFNMFRSGRSYTSSDLHHLHLDHLPAINTDNPKELQWFNGLIGMTLSTRERKIQVTCKSSPSPSNPRDVLLSVKQSLGIIFMASVGLGPQGAGVARVFVLHDSSVGGFAMIFVSDVRLDPGAYSVVADAWVLPLTRDVLPLIENGIRNTVGSTLTIKTGPEEARAWMRLLPALVERCRTWVHKPDCSYIKSNDGPPLSLEPGKNPLCRCGAGISADTAFKKYPAWKPFAPYVTRAGISPLFPVSFLESVELAGSPTVCTFCGKSGGKLLVCSGCKNSWYCSGYCQRKDWKGHKVFCTR